MDLDEELARRLQEEEYQDLQQEQAAAPDDIHVTDAPFKDLHGAGLCVYQPKAHFCSIRLSEPLLKFRPESDYIDTLLHEMIHAYLFITKAIQDHDGHGEDVKLIPKDSK
ncbi:hypothetical protein DFQ27_009779 [Actinomortierella ambigua]|uniref:SprT-like domain-containing protein n=1 Tax=Actinomortierella ambigua TaxID=1343610 RepID=A0A9P6UAL4_9FUNG|nr:hypothetical protein DFQ27_009779 [Actinomortierella ambigua]